MQRKIKLTRWFVYEWGKLPRQKPHRVILRSPLTRIHYYHYKQLQVKDSQYLIPTYSWTLTSILNWTCSVVIISHFSMQCSQYVTNQLMHESKYVTNHQLEKDVGCKILQFIHMMKIKKFFGYKTLRRTNVTASYWERWTKAYVSGSNILVKNFCIKLHSLASVVTTLKIILIYV